jgi:hypothetical protein
MNCFMGRVFSPAPGKGHIMCRGWGHPNEQEDKSQSGLLLTSEMVGMFLLPCFFTLLSLLLCMKISNLFLLKLDH